MYIILFMVLFTVVYVVSFKDNFNQENINKVTPILACVVIFSILLSIITSVV